MSASAAVMRASPAFSGVLRHAGLALAPSRTDALQQPSITLLLERLDEQGERFTSLAVAPGETISAVKLRVSKRSAFTSRHCLVLGDRELLDDGVTVGELAAAMASGKGAATSYLHIVCKLKDMEMVSVTTSMHRTLSFAAAEESPGPIRRSKSALTALLADSPDSPVSPHRPSPCSPTENRGLALRRSPSLSPDGIVHLIIRKSAGVHWRHQPGAKLELSISADATAEAVAAELEAVNDLPANQHLLMYNGKILAADQSLASYGIDHDGAVLELVPLASGTTASGSPPLSSPEHGLFADWQAAQAGLASGLRPQLASSGSGGSYFIPNRDGEKVAVLKPADEEPYMGNNPRKMGRSPDGHGLRKGIRPGEGAVREVAAYVLDHGHFAGVPPTAMVSCQPHMLPGSCGRGTALPGAKVGSLQQFVKADTDCEEQGVSGFPCQEVHKIAQLDMRMANTDRNGGNILARRDKDGQWQLIPIDHGYTLPDSFQDLCFDWLNWPQAHVPFNEETRAYIAALDADADLALLAAHGLHLRSECKRVFKASTMCLKMGAARGLSPYTIGSIMSRELRMASPLEKLHRRATMLARGMTFSLPAAAASINGSQSQDAAYFEALEALLAEYLDEIVLDGVVA